MAYSNCLLGFFLSRSEAPGEAMARHLAIEPAPHQVREFEDGEHTIRPLTDVEAADCDVGSSLAGDVRVDSDQQSVRMLFFIGAPMDAGAARVTVVTLYLACGRKDRRTRRREPLTTRYTACPFEAGPFQAEDTDAIVAMRHERVNCRVVALESGSADPSATAGRSALRDPCVPDRRRHHQVLLALGAEPEFVGAHHLEPVLPVEGQGAPVFLPYAEPDAVAAVLCGHGQDLVHELWSNALAVPRAAHVDPVQLSGAPGGHAVLGGVEPDLGEPDQSVVGFGQERYPAGVGDLPGLDLGCKALAAMDLHVHGIVALRERVPEGAFGQRRQCRGVGRLGAPNRGHGCALGNPCSAIRSRLTSAAQSLASK